MKTSLAAFLLPGLGLPAAFSQAASVTRNTGSQEIKFNTFLVQFYIFDGIIFGLFNHMFILWINTLQHFLGHI